jgi:hypothetical protein
LWRAPRSRFSCSPGFAFMDSASARSGGVPQSVIRAAME